MRLRFQFRPRTLLIVVGVLLLLGVCWAANEARIAKGRAAMLRTIKEHGGDYQERLANDLPISFVRRWCGDRRITTIWLPHDLSGPTRDQIHAIFPNAQILVAF